MLSLTIEDTKILQLKSGQIIRPFVSRLPEVGNKLRDTLVKLCELALLFKFVLGASGIIHIACQERNCRLPYNVTQPSKMSILARAASCLSICLLCVCVRFVCFVDACNLSAHY